MSRPHGFPTEPIKADPSPGRWLASGSSIYAHDGEKVTQVADCALPGSDMNHMRSNIDDVEKMRAVARANAQLMARAKDAILLLKEAQLQLPPESFGLRKAISDLIEKAGGRP